ncbi:ferredoxin [Streptomyces millisiae]|uniref:Ferredoxin n=1 Tax=Streptomyces millisiae TaxID=3075542 RepID=A0ABU2M0P8_9ACTN|nr:ferredoxin [Streptomyces sp. DSM 44918]MDT0323389.1 ferredoxin [Streptomyces sp. DSM 44918]
MTRIRVEADQSRCVSTGMCALLAPELFDQSERDGTVRVRTPAPDDGQRAAAAEAAARCPAGAIRISGG